MSICNFKNFSGPPLTGEGKREGRKKGREEKGRREGDG
jgi:hypothetical protein